MREAIKFYFGFSNVVHCGFRQTLTLCERPKPDVTKNPEVVCVKSHAYDTIRTTSRKVV
jgi:hypothetical protein